MDRMKTNFKWVLIIIAFFFLSNLAINWIINDSYRDMASFKVETGFPKITISESKKTNVNGYIVGKITNNTGARIDDKYIKFDFYNKNGTYVGTDYVEIDNLKTGEEREFEHRFRYSKVESFTVDFAEGADRESFELSIPIKYPRVIWMIATVIVWTAVPPWFLGIIP